MRRWRPPLPAATAMAPSAPRNAIRAIPQAGARSAATRPARAAPARSTSIATAGFPDGVPATAPALLRKQQRLDHHRHDTGRIEQFADIDIVELAQLHAVDRNELAVQVQLLLDDAAKPAPDVAVDHQYKQLVALAGRRRKRH